MSKIMTNCQGDLVSTRNGHVIRSNYCYHHVTIKNSHDLRATIRAGKYTFPGGYPLYLISKDTAPICFDCTKKDYEHFADAQRELSSLRIVSCAINYEDEHLYCEHCNSKIESAYGETE